MLHLACMNDSLSDAICVFFGSCDLRPNTCRDDAVITNVLKLYAQEDVLERLSERHCIHAACMLIPTLTLNHLKHKKGYHLLCRYVYMHVGACCDGRHPSLTTAAFNLAGEVITTYFAHFCVNMLHWYQFARRTSHRVILHCKHGRHQSMATDMTMSAFLSWLEVEVVL